MAAAIGRIVVQDQIALVDIVSEVLGDGLHGGDQRAKMDRNILALQDHLRLGIEKGGRVVVGKIEDRGTGGFLEG